MKISFPEQKWIIEGLIPHNSVCVMGGKRSSFKTWVALNLAMSIVAGKKFLDVFETKQSNIVLYFALSLSKDLFNTNISNDYLNQLKPNIVKKKLFNLWLNKDNILWFNRKIESSYVWRHFIQSFRQSL